MTDFDRARSASVWLVSAPRIFSTLSLALLSAASRSEASANTSNEACEPEGFASAETSVTRPGVDGADGFPGVPTAETDPASSFRLEPLVSVEVAPDGFVDEDDFADGDDFAADDVAPLLEDAVPLFDGFFFPPEPGGETNAPAPRISDGGASLLPASL